MTDPTRELAAREPRACGAKTRSGAPCKTAPVDGADRCRMHGGNTAKAKERALTAMLAGELKRMDFEPMTDPLGAYADLAGEVWAFKELCREQINRLTTWVGFTKDEEEHARALVVIYERALDRASKMLHEMLRLGLDAQALRQAKERPSREQAEAFSGVLDRLLGELGLSDEQRDRVPAALADALRGEGLL